MDGQRHLVKCRCVLPQFRHSTNPPVHHFMVFSIADDNDVVKPKCAQCNNCGVIHKITEFGKSEILPNKEFMSTIVTIADIKNSLPPNFALVLEANNADLSSWEAAQFYHEHKKWGNFVVLTTETEGSVRRGN